MLTLSKSKFKARALEYFREVETSREPAIITDHGKPVLKLIPYQKESHQNALKVLKGSVVKYLDPLSPVAEEEWEALK